MPTKIIPLPSQEDLQSKFYYKDGTIYWKERLLSRGRPSSRAHKEPNVWIDKSGYYRVTIEGKHYMLSRIIYQICFGDLTPEFEIDHEDRDITNNKIENLRKVPQLINKRNRRKQRNCGSDDTGVSICKKKHPKPNEHKITEYWVARWCDINGIIKSKAFRIDTLGNDEAYSQAVEYRKRMIAELNKNGAGYSDNHGY